MSSADTQYSAWNPGLSSQIPSSLQPEITLFRAGNSTVDYRTAKELADFSGLKPAELVAFRIERLIVHDLLVRVTSDLSVRDGPNYEDLGINLRTMVHTIYSDYVLPDIEEYRRAFDAAHQRCETLIKEELDSRLFASPSTMAASAKPSLITRWFGKKTSMVADADSSTQKELNAVEYWQQCAHEESDVLKRSCYQSVQRVVSALVAHRGSLVNQPQLITTIAVNMALNRVGSELAQTMVEPVFKRAVAQEKFRWLPVQKQPVVMNVKGASASGKSTIRPQQRQLAGALGIPWKDFALISPDYWRKYLLDYDSLGDDYKYAAMLTGQELEIVDRKLDRYMADKARRHQVSHLLIDRFRFDSFSVDAGKSQDSKLLSRFGDRIYLFFMVTPPAETVVRAWERGKTTGRFKAVDDLLYHNIEAYTGMPELFLSWVLSADKKVHFEFLDNDVRKGDLPKTAAFGSNQLMTIIDVNLMLNIDRFRQVNIEARTADEVLITQSDEEGGFLVRCISGIAEVRLLDANTHRIYAVFNHGDLIWCDQELLNKQPCSRALTNILAACRRRDDKPEATAPELDVQAAREDTIGSWG